VDFLNYTRARPNMFSVLQWIGLSGRKIIDRLI